MHWWVYDGLNMSAIFKQVNFLNFVKILKKKWTIFIDWNSVCNSESQNLINQDNFSQKIFCKIINAITSFHKKKFFLIPTGEMIFFDMGKKYTNFVQKFITQKIFKTQKEFFVCVHYCFIQATTDQIQQHFKVWLNELKLRIKRKITREWIW